MKKLIGLLALVSIVLLTVGCPQPENPTLETYTVTFAAGDGASGTMAEVTFIEGVAKDLPLNTFTPPANKVFAYWETSSGVQYADGALFEATENTTLTAMWTDGYTVTFKANGGEGNDYTQTFTAGVSQSLLQNSFTHATKVFAGWATENNASTVRYANGAVYQALKNTTLYAVWVDSVAVTFAPNGGTGDAYVQTFALGETKALTLNNYTAPSGMGFYGWKSSETLNYADYPNGADYTATENTTLYAHWRPLRTITYDANGGSGTMESQAFVQGLPQALTLNAFTAPVNKVFAGWSTSSTATTAAYLNGQNYTAGGGGGTFYAVWTHRTLVKAELSIDETTLTVTPSEEASGTSTLKTAIHSVVTDSNRGKITTINIVQPTDGSKIIPEDNLSNLFGDDYDPYSMLTTIDGLQYVDTTNVTSMYSMFEGCSSLTSLNLSSFVTTNVTSMSQMFQGCRSLTSLNLSSFVTTNVTTMFAMFAYCSSLTSLNLSSFVTTNVTTMANMFNNCSKLTSLDLSGFNTENVTSVEWMFYYCNAITEAYGKTQADCDKFNDSSYKPSNVNFVVKTP